MRQNAYGTEKLMKKVEKNDGKEEFSALQGPYDRGEGGRGVGGGTYVHDSMERMSGAGPADCVRKQL